MLGTEKRMRAAYGEGVDDETLRKYQNSSPLAFVAFVTAVAALLLGLVQFSGLTEDKAALNAVSIQAARESIRGLEARLAVVEGQNGADRDLLINALISDLGAKAGFLSGQTLTEPQKARLLEALGPLLPAPAPQVQAAPAAPQAPAAPAQ